MPLKIADFEPIADQLIGSVVIQLCAQQMIQTLDSKYRKASERLTKTFLDEELKDVMQAVHTA